jgi:hypothetical protein
MGVKTKSAAFWLIQTLLFFASFLIRAEISPRDYAVLLSADVQSSPALIHLRWQPSELTGTYRIARKNPGDGDWHFVTEVGADVFEYYDPDVSPGEIYEYEVRQIVSDLFQPTGYIASAIEAPLVEERGRVILLIDSSFVSDLSTELARLETDLVADGWLVSRYHVAREASAQSVKDRITGEYWNDPGRTRAVFIIGHVPVPYSGSFTADDHHDHIGAWSADTYYADIDEDWTDYLVSTQLGGQTREWNFPGDGKFDQSDLPSDLELEVGRVDFHDLPSFDGISELELLRRYLNKDHAYRIGWIQTENRGLISDNFGESGGEAFASSGWRNFSTFFGADNIDVAGYNEFFPMLTSRSYLWAYACGGGAFDFCNGVGGPGDWNFNDARVVFTMLFGSYFGDFDADNDFMRASLGSENYTLVAGWAGRPHWFLHRMALGDTIGAAAKLSANNGLNGLYQCYSNAQTRMVHVALLGDPTLRMFGVAPPENVGAIQSGGQVTVSWTASTDPSLVGYVVYRAQNASGPFARLSYRFVTDSTFTDLDPFENAVYMVRAVALRQTASGTFYDASPGVTVTPLLTLASRISIVGEPGSVVKIQQSSDLMEWNDRESLTLSDGENQMSITFEGKNQFFRAVYDDGNPSPSGSVPLILSILRK